MQKEKKMKKICGFKTDSEDQTAIVECLYREWDRARSNDDLEAMLTLYGRLTPLRKA